VMERIEMLEAVNRSLSQWKATVIDARNTRSVDSSS
jgi:hypothetical protein